MFTELWGHVSTVFRILLHKWQRMFIWFLKLNENDHASDPAVRTDSQCDKSKLGGPRYVIQNVKIILISLF